MDTGAETYRPVDFDYYLANMPSARKTRSMHLQ